jgi:RND family efflux transporter MFP subunit
VSSYSLSKEGHFFNQHYFAFTKKLGFLSPLKFMSYLRRKVFTDSVSVALLGLVTVAELVFAQPQAALVGVDAVRREPLAQTIPVIGRLVARQSGVVAGRTSGYMDKLYVDVGDQVERGQVLAQLDQAHLRARIALREADLKEFQAQRATELATEKLAQQQLERLKKLRNTAAFNQSLYDTQVRELAVARSSREEMEARIARGQVSLALAETQLEYGTIRAPFSGIVTLRNTNEGAWLEQGDSVVTLVNDRSLEIEADVPQARLTGLLPGTQVTLLLDDGTQHQARVRARIPDENLASRTRPVRFSADFGTVNVPLAVNQPVTLKVPLGPASQVVSVHKDAVLRHQGRASVYVIENGKAQSREVTLGPAVGSRFQVQEGLEPGDIVVIRGNERLRPGQPVSYPGQPDDNPNREQKS